MNFPLLRIVRERMRGREREREREREETKKLQTAFIFQNVPYFRTENISGKY